MTVKHGTFLVRSQGTAFVVSFSRRLYFRRDALHAIGPFPSLPTPGWWFKGGLWLGCARLCGIGYLWALGLSLVCQDSIVASRFKQVLGSRDVLTQWNVTLVPLCKYHISNDVFSRCKSVHKMATGKSDDELIRIGTRSGKLITVD